ncbi:MAG TPA: glycosyltransferase family A protein [Terriglobia bacterium]|nr:glycosyltransferase family A protein [Terriglobia bacterium]
MQADPFPANPRVSVIVPAYNTAHLIAATLDSVFSQTFKEFEVIVVNDGAPDTPDLERVLASYRDRIRYIKQENQGVGAARNAGIRNASGEFLAFPDSDDLWLPDFLAGQLKFFEEHPGLDLVCADCIYFGDSDLAGKSWQALDPIQDPVTFEKILPTHGGAFASFVLMRRAAALKVGSFEEERPLLEDYHYWLRLLYGGGRMAYNPKILGRRRIHSGSLTYNHEVVIPQAVKALQKLEAILDPSSKEADLVRQQILAFQYRLYVDEGKRSLAAGDFKAALRSFEAAYAAAPSRKVRLTLVGLRWAPGWTRWATSLRDRRLSDGPG